MVVRLIKKERNVMDGLMGGLSVILVILIFFIIILVFIYWNMNRKAKIEQHPPTVMCPLSSRQTKKQKRMC